jgi:uncharacterized membrane protein YjfL (UPF0719 family)
MKLLLKIFGWAAVGIGVWLVFWNPIDFLTQGIDHGIWDTSIITGGLLSMIVGVIILVFMAHKGRHVLV